MRAAAVQLEVVIGDVRRNLDECERLAREAAGAGAEIVALPELFTTGATFEPALADAALAPDGAAAEFLSRVAREQGIISAARSSAVTPMARSATPTCWRRQPARSSAAMTRTFPPCGRTRSISAALTTASSRRRVCWEFMRTQTARRLRGRVDVVIGGSNWWSIPNWRPRAVTE